MTEQNGWSRTKAYLNFHSPFCEDKVQTMFCSSTSKSQDRFPNKRLKTIRRKLLFCLCREEIKEKNLSALSSNMNIYLYLLTLRFYYC